MVVERGNIGIRTVPTTSLRSFSTERSSGTPSFRFGASTARIVSRPSSQHERSTFAFGRSEGRIKTLSRPDTAVRPAVAQRIFELPKLDTSAHRPLTDTVVRQPFDLTKTKIVAQTKPEIPQGRKTTFLNKNADAFSLPKLHIAPSHHMTDRRAPRSFDLNQAAVLALSHPSTEVSEFKPNTTHYNRKMNAPETKSHKIGFSAFGNAVRTPGPFPQTLSFVSTESPSKVKHIDFHKSPNVLKTNSPIQNEKLQSSFEASPSTVHPIATELKKAISPQEKLQQIPKLNEKMPAVVGQPIILDLQKIITVEQKLHTLSLNTKTPLPFSSEISGKTINLPEQKNERKQVRTLPRTNRGLAILEHKMNKWQNQHSQKPELVKKKNALPMGEMMKKVAVLKKMQKRWLQFRMDVVTMEKRMFHIHSALHKISEKQRRAGKSRIDGATIASHLPDPAILPVSLMSQLLKPLWVFRPRDASYSFVYNEIANMGNIGIHEAANKAQQINRKYPAVKLSEQEDTPPVAAEDIQLVMTDIPARSVAKQKAA